MDEELDKHAIRGLITVLRKTIPNIFSPLIEGAVVLHRVNTDGHAYDFKMDRNVTSDEAEVILELINEWTQFDYIMEITTSEAYDLPCGEDEQDITAMNHNRWVQKQVNGGWRYGLVFNEELKTDPRLRPYHELSERLKNL